MAGVGFAIAGTVLAAAGVTQSFIQAGKQSKLRREAQDEAAKSLEAAEKIFAENKLKGISLPKEVYELEQEALLSSGEQALRAAQEADPRSLAATSGRIQAAQQTGQRKIATSQADRLLELELMGAKEDARLQSGLANLKLTGVAGAQQAARDAQMAEMQAVSQGFEGLKKLGGTVVDYKNELVPLFKRQKTTPGGVFDFSSLGMDTMSSLNMPALGMTDVQNFQQFINPAIPINNTIASPTDIYNPANYTNPLTQ